MKDLAEIVSDGGIRLPVFETTTSKMYRTNKDGDEKERTFNKVFVSSYLNNKHAK